MCFSAPASFATSAALVPAGAYCVGVALRNNKSLLGLAIIPFVFSAQQFLEGLVWTGIDTNNLALRRGAAFGFLFFALTFWPFWVPFYAYMKETDAPKKRFLGMLTVLGLLGGQILFVPILLYPEVLIVEVLNHSIVYNFALAPGFRQMPRVWWQLAYLVVVGVPLLIAPSRGFARFGLALLISAIVTQIFFWMSFVSVWCFFAALLSLQLCLSFRAVHSPPKAIGPAVPIDQAL